MSGDRWHLEGVSVGVCVCVGLQLVFTDVLTQTSCHKVIQHLSFHMGFLESISPEDFVTIHVVCLPTELWSISCLNSISRSSIYNLSPLSCAVAITTFRLNAMLKSWQIEFLQIPKCNFMRICPCSYQTLILSVTFLFVAMKRFVRVKCQTELQNTPRDFGWLRYEANALYHSSGKRHKHVFNAKTTQRGRGKNPEWHLLLLPRQYSQDGEKKLI